MASGYDTKFTTNPAEPETKITKVVEGEVVKGGKAHKKRISDAFIAEDIDVVAKSIWSDVVVPTIKQGIFDVISNGIKMLMWGDKAPKPGYPGSKFTYGGVTTAYGSFFSQPQQMTPAKQHMATYSYDDLTFKTRSDAQSVLDVLDEQISRYGRVSVGDLYDAAGVTPDQTAYNYGWENLKSAEVYPCPGGFHIKFPRAKVIK